MLILHTRLFVRHIVSTTLTLKLCELARVVNCVNMSLQPRIAVSTDFCIEPGFIKFLIILDLFFKGGGVTTSHGKCF